jgi:hypothetical protein
LGAPELRRQLEIGLDVPYFQAVVRPAVGGLMGVVFLKSLGLMELSGVYSIMDFLDTI